MSAYPDTVFTNVESVTPDTPGTVLLGVSVAVQPATIPTGNAACVARPWTWTAITWTVLGRLAAAGSAWQLIPSGSIAVRPIPADPNEAAWGTVISALKTSIGATADMLAAGPQGPDLTPVQTIKVGNSSFQKANEDVAVGQKWVSLLLNLAAAPYPIPDKLQLTCFLELTGSTQFAQFVALPTFTADKTYDPSTQLPSSATSPDVWEVASVNGLKMHSEFSRPEMGSLLPDNTLWLPPAHPATSNPLVADWQAHLYDLLGPYLDTAHVLTTPAFDSADLYNFPAHLRNALGTAPANWTLFRGCVLKGLHTLVSAPASGTASPYDAGTWTSLLSSQLAAVLNPLPAALSPNPVDSTSFDLELADLRCIVTAACTGTTLGKLVLAENNTVPASYFSADRAPALLALLQARLATAYTQAVASAANSTPPLTVPPTPTSPPDILNVVLQNLLQSVIRTNLLTQISPIFPAASPLPKALGAVCYPPFDPTATPPAPPSPSTTFRDDLFTLALGTTQPGAAPALTANAPPLVLPAVMARAADNTANAVDPLRGIRGVSVLLRRKGSKPTTWTCPGIVAPMTQHKDRATQILVDDPQTDLPLLVATRLLYDRDLMTGSMLYNNGPFGCANLLHDYLDIGDRLRHLKPGDLNAPQGTVDLSAIPASALQFVSYEGGGRLTPGTAELWAGASYEFVTFAISNSGALPVDLRDTYPARFKPLVGALPAGVRSSNIRYFRTVPVAGLDTCDANGNRLRSTSTLFPVVPANVWPRATDTVTPAGGIGITGAVQTLGPLPHLPLLLLTPPVPNLQSAARTTPNLTFSVRLPSVDPQTWLTTSGYAHPKADVVLDGAYLLLQQQKHARITDPLITSVDFTLYNWQNAAWSPASAPVSYTVAELRNMNPDALPGVETLPIVIAADSTSANNGIIFNVLDFDGKAKLPRGAKTIAGAGNFTLEPGELYLLEARLQLSLDGPEGDSMMPGYAPGHAALPPGVPATSPPAIAGYQLLLEIGSAALPFDLIAPLSLNHLPLGGVPDQQVQFRMAVNGPNWRNVHRVDFLRQMWRWTGRTQPVISTTASPGDLLKPQFFPAALAGKLTDPVPAAWELIEFAERPPADHIESLSTLKLATANDPAAFEFTLDLSLDLRATYLRVAPRIFSRYQGLFAVTSWYVVSTIDGDPEKAQWARTFVRSRTRTLKIPRLKGLLPLTESAFAPGTPGILAIFDGAAYDQAGLAERLTVDFAPVADPDLSGNIWAQAGPDFLAGPTAAMTTPGQQRNPKLVCIGPIGHTDDSLSGLDHKFLSHSYILRPDPDDPNTKKQDLSWWFAALRFQLTTDAASTVFAQPIVSETSFGSWIQFLPGFQTPDTHQADLFDSWTFSVDTSTALPPRPDGIPAGGETFTLRDASGNIQTPGMQTTHLTPFLMINRVVLDIAGVPREDYFGVAIHSGRSYILLAGSNWNSVTKAQVRVIQTREGVATAFRHHAEFWQSVAGPATAQFTGDTQRTVPVNLSAPIKAAPAR